MSEQHTKVRTTILTGVSRGLGAALFDRLDAAGDRLIGLGRRFTSAQQQRAASDPERVMLRRADLAQPTTLPAAAERVEALAGTDHAVLIHHAAVVGPIGAVGSLPPEPLADAVTVNLTAPMLLTNAFLAAVPAEAAATVLFISSGAAHRIIGGWSVYSATKRGGEMFVEAVAAQLARRPRTRVTSVNPGVMDTDMQAALRDAAREGVWFPDADRYLALHEQGQLPHPDQVAARIIEEHLTEPQT